MSGGSKSQETKVQGWEPARKAIKNDLLPEMQNYIGDYKAGQGLHEGTQLAAESGYTQDMQKMMLALQPQMAQHMDSNVNVLQGFLGGAEGASNQARREAFADQAIAQFNDNVRPAIEDRSTFAGQYGGPQAALAMGRAAGDVGRDIASLESQMAENDATRQFQAMQVAPSLFMSRLIPAQMRGEVGRQQTERRQLELADAIQQFEAPRRNRYQSLMEGQQLLAPLTGTASVTSGGGGMSPLQGALGGAAIGSTFGAPGAAIGAGLGALGSFL